MTKILKTIEIYLVDTGGEHDCQECIFYHTSLCDDYHIAECKTGYWTTEKPEDG